MEKNIKIKDIKSWRTDSVKEQKAFLKANKENLHLCNTYKSIINLRDEIKLSQIVAQIVKDNKRDFKKALNVLNLNKEVLKLTNNKELSIEDIKEIIYNNTYVVYQYTNQINGKMYIGLTRNEESRKKQHQKAPNECQIFHRAINKYGFETFKYQVLERYLTLECANLLEQLYIALFDSVSNGYNVTLGGEGVKKIIFSTSQKDNIIYRYVDNEEAVLSIAYDYNVSQEFMAEFLKSQGVKMRAPGAKKKKSNEDNEKELLLRLVNEGSSPVAIATKLDMSEDVIRKKFSKYKITCNKSAVRKENIKMVNNLALQGKNALEIKNELNIGLTTVYEHLNVQIKSKQKKRVILSQEDKNNIIYLYTVLNMSTSEIASQYNVRPSTISYLLKNNGIKIINKRHEKIKMRRQKIKEDYDNGMSDNDICQKYDICVQTLKRDLQFLGVKYKKIERKAKIVSNNIQDAICKDYLNGMAINMITVKYNLNKKVIHQILESNNIKIRTSPETKALQKKLRLQNNSAII